MKTVIVIGLALALVSCHPGVPQAHTTCREDFRNDTQGVLSDADLATAWQHAQQTIAEGKWVINALDCDERHHLGIACLYHQADAAALAITPECLGVRGVQGRPYPGADGVTDDSHNIAINISEGHDRAWALASYEMENALGIRLGFPMGNR